MTCFFSWLRTSASRSETLYLTENSWKVASGDFRLYGLGVCGDGDWELDAKYWFQNYYYTQKQSQKNSGNPCCNSRNISHFLYLYRDPSGKTLQVEYFWKLAIRLIYMGNLRWKPRTTTLSHEEVNISHGTHSVFVWVWATWYGCFRK